MVLRIKLRYQDVDTFIDKFAINLSRGGMFIASRSPKAIGTEIRFELKLADTSTVISGVGVVRWTRDFDPEKPRSAHGMGIEFVELSENSKSIIAGVVILGFVAYQLWGTGIMTAHMDSVPMVVITGQVPNVVFPSGMIVERFDEEGFALDAATRRELSEILDA